MSVPSTLEKTLNIRIPTDMHTQLSALTKATGRSKSFLALEAIESYLTYQSWQIKEIESGIIEADKGEFSSEREVQAIFMKYAK